MKYSTFITSFFATVAFGKYVPHRSRALNTSSSLIVYDTPQTLRPYVLPKGYGLKAGGGDSWNFYVVTGNSSGGAFCLMVTDGPSSGGQGVFPHVHMKTYENFYASKGSVQLWGQNLDSYKRNESTQQTRILTQGDLGTIPNNTIHTFQLTEPDTTLTGVLVPGGFEQLFFDMAKNFSIITDEKAMESYDVYPQPSFVPRTDMVNNKAGSGNWHNGTNNLTGSTMGPAFIAKNYGPKYLNNELGYYQLIATLVTGKESDNRFTQGTITMSPKGADQHPSYLNLTQPVAFQMEEGLLEITVAGETVELIDGDVFFVPRHTPFHYHTAVPFTKFMYVSGGADGLDAQLLKNAIPWNSAFYPDYANATAPTMKRTEQVEWMEKYTIGGKI